jgi:hypothetical protein
MALGVLHPKFCRHVVWAILCVPNRNSPPAILLRESYRQDGKVKTRTLANITHLSA